MRRNGRAAGRGRAMVDGVDAGGSCSSPWSPRRRRRSSDCAAGVNLTRFVAGGPAFARNLDCRLTAEGVSAQDCTEDFRILESAVNTADRGVVLSGGLDFTVPGLGGLTPDARWIRGLARLSEDSAGGDVRNQAFSPMLGHFLGS